MRPLQITGVRVEEAQGSEPLVASVARDSSMTGAPVAPVAVLPSRFARVIEDQEKSISLFLIEENAVRVTTGKLSP